MERNFIYKLAAALSEDLEKLAGALGGKKALIDVMPKGEAIERGRKQIYKTLALLGTPAAYLMGVSSGKRKQLQDIMYPKQQTKVGSSVTNDEETIVKMGALFIHKLANENKDLLNKVASYETQDKAIKIAIEMIEKGIIGPNQFNTKVSELVKNGSAGMVIVMEKANKDLQLSESSDTQISDVNGINEFESFLLN